MIKALRRPQIFRLWIGQAFSTIGDEIYRVGLTWFAVGLMGANVGYLAAAQTASLMLLSFIGGKWADHWHPLRTMISVDLMRAGIVLVPVAISIFRPPSLEVLWVVALSLSALSAFFDPATQTLIPLLAKDREMIRSTNGLMATTFRLARMVGPAVVGLLSALIPMVHFFTIDALTFFASAGSIFSLRSELPNDLREKSMKRTSFLSAISSGFKLLRAHEGMSYVMLGKGIVAGAWNLAMLIGFPLLIHDMTNGDARAFGLVMASYGLGNFIGSLFFGTRSRANSYHLLFDGYIVMGLGFVWIGFAPTLVTIMIAAAATGFTGPMNDLGIIEIFQTKFPGRDLTKVFRLRLAAESAFTLLFTLNAAWMIKLFSVRSVIVFAGAAFLFFGLIRPPKSVASA